MIRVSGEVDGVRAIVLVLQPDNVWRLVNGEPIMLDLRPLAADRITGELHLHIEAPADFQERARQLLDDAQASAAPIRVIGKPAEQVQ